MDLYSERAVQNTIDAFSDIARIIWQKKAPYYELTFEKCRADEELTMKEFGNFVLAETIKGRREIYD